MNFNVKANIKRFLDDNSGLAFIEGAILLPFMITLLFGMYDIGQAIIINQKVTAASHMAADLITRKTVINDSDFSDAVGVAKLVIDPFNRDLMGIDIVGIKFDEDSSPTEMWRHTHNMDQTNSLPSSADGLGVQGEGLVAIATIYDYTPYFSGVLVGNFQMQEISFLRGRKNSFIRYEENE